MLAAKYLTSYLFAWLSSDDDENIRQMLLIHAFQIKCLEIAQEEKARLSKRRCSTKSEAARNCAPFFGLSQRYVISESTAQPCEISGSFCPILASCHFLGVGTISANRTIWPFCLDTQVCI
jgi:hypothetical protein